MAIPLLAAAFWLLGNVKRTYWINDSPNGRFSTSMVTYRGWRSPTLDGRYLIYVTDNKTGESILATNHPSFCVWNQIALSDIKWNQDNRRFTCLWSIIYNGIHKQEFAIKLKPLRVQAGPPCCGTE